MRLQSSVKNLKFTQNKNIKVMGRVGYAARAVVHGLVGIFAILLTFQQGGALTGTRGIMPRLMGQPFGKLILGAIAVGLFFFSIWRFMQAIRDYENKGTSLKGIAVRLGYGISAIAYAALGYSAANLILRLSRPSNGSGEEEIAQTLLGQSFGVILLGIVALVVVGVGLSQIYVAVKDKFKEGLSLPRSSEWLTTICKVGIIARGVVFCLTGWFFLRAAMQSDSSEAGGLNGVWKFLAAQNYGSVLVTAMAVGLIAFSVYGFTEAAYRRSVREGRTPKFS